MQPYVNFWLNATKHWTAIATSSPLVINERLRAMAASGHAPSAALLTEMARMTSEKGEALVESGAAIWWATIHAQQLAWQRAWRAGRLSPAPKDFALASSTARKLVAAWVPVSRRVTANAKRLSASKGGRKRRR